jgi:hypothetical protein
MPKESVVAAPAGQPAINEAHAANRARWPHLACAGTCRLRNTVRHSRPPQKATLPRSCGFLPVFVSSR